MQFQTREKPSRSISPNSRSELVHIIPRSQSPNLTKQQIQNTKFYNRFYRQEQRYRLLQEQIDAEIKAKANKRKITENSYRIVAHYLQQRIQQVLQKFETIGFAQLGRVFTELEVFEIVSFDQNNKLATKEQDMCTRGKQEMIMHELFWNLVSQDGQDEQVETQLVNYVLRVIMDPVKLSVEETGELVLDMLNYDTTNCIISLLQEYQQKFYEAKRLVIQFRALTQNKLFIRNQDKKKEHENKIKEEQLRELTFAPAINERSQILASQNRMKYLQQQNQPSSLFEDSEIEQKSTHSQSCIDVLYKKQEDFNSKIQEKQKEKEMDKMKECTFHPKINPNHSQNSTMDVVSRLYTEESINWKRQYQDEHFKQIKQERERQELSQCTFTPNINDGIPLSPQSNIPKDFERAVGRMRYANEQNRIKYEKLNHVSTGEKFEKLKNAPFNPPQMVNRQKVKRKPIVIMDVNIAPGKQGKLALFEDDDPQEVVKKFAQLFNLNKEMYDILLDVLEKERQKILNKRNT